MRTQQTRITARRNARRTWQVRKALASWSAVDPDFDGEPDQLPVTAAEHYKLEAWLRQHKPPTF
jgi:hypothetical protein